MRRFILRLLSAVRHSRAESELSREIDAHLSLLEDDFVKQGMSREDARFAARRAFGGVEQAKEHQRDARGFRWIDNSRSDVVLGLRMLRKYPGLSIIGGLGLAVGIAIGSAFLAFFSTYLYSTLPVPDGDRVVALENWDVARNNEERRAMHDLWSWREGMTSVGEISAFRTVGRNLFVPGGTVEPVRVAQMTASAFRLTRTAPLFGRYLVDADERTGAPAVVVIGHDVWTTRFARDPAVVGREIRLGNIVHTIVGVMPERFAFPVNHRYWTALPTDTSTFARGQGPAVFIFGRLRDGATMTEAQAELSALGARAAAEYPASHAKLDPRVMPYAYPILDIQGIETWQFNVMQGLVSLVLVVVAINVAMLVYARTATRQGEIAVRSALGASRARIVWQLFVEALVLSSAAAVAGIAIASVGLSQSHAIMRAEGADLPYWIDLGMPVYALVYAAGLALVAALIAGVVPALQATGRRTNRTLKLTSSTGSVHLGRTWTMMIVGQVAVAVVALPLIVATAWTDIQGALTAPAFDDTQFLGAMIGADPDLAPGVATERTARDTVGRMVKLRDDFIARVESEPAVEDVTYAASLPGDEPRARVVIAATTLPGSSAPMVRQNFIAADFFDALDARILQGRAFTSADATGPPVVVVTRAFVNQLLGRTNPIGVRVQYDSTDASDTALKERTTVFEIVGVVDDLEVNRAKPELVRPVMFHPFADAARFATIVRVRGRDAASFSPRVREIVSTLDPSARMVISPFSELQQQRVIALRLLVTVATLVVLSVILLSSAGVYAMLSFAVSQRRKEIGIRAAMGADGVQLLRSIFARAAFQLSAGVGIGILGAVALDVSTGGAFLSSTGRGVLPLTAALMMLVGIAAAVGPARRGLRVQPTEALRAE